MAWISFSPSPGVSLSANVDDSNIEEYRRFATQHDGDAGRGKKLFADEERLGCTKCHTIDGRGTKAAPDLLAVGDKFTRRDLIESVLVPSATIAVGYSTTIVETKTGEEYVGILKQATDAWIELAGGDGQRTRIPTRDIQEQRGSSVSLMPEGLHAGLPLRDFADLIEYLVSLKQPETSLMSNRGMPDIIPELTTPVALRPFFGEDLRFPHSVVRSPGDVLTGLVGFAPVPGSSNVFLVIHQAGKIWRLEKNAAGDSKSLFADLTPQVFSARGPNGLLGFAFHPKFRQNRKYYLKHQVFKDGKIATVLAERLAAPDFKTDSGQPSVRLLEIMAVAEHHNGGCIQFGPDRFLYFGMGDSAPNNDPQGHGQDLRLLFGKMLRIDVDRQDPGSSYAIPRDNPFWGRTGARPEIWAYGLREPWRFSFDSITGDLWVADLGQERGDEVAIVRRGENHGWNVYEGFEPFSNQYRKEGVAYVPPIFSNRPKHGVTAIGGYVYRGDPQSSFYGVYIFGDYTSKRVWGLTHENRALKSIRQIAASPEPITSFATDDQGNIYVVGYEGMIYRLDFAGASFEKFTSLAGSSGSAGKARVLSGGRVKRAE